MLYLLYSGLNEPERSFAIYEYPIGYGQLWTKKTESGVTAANYGYKWDILIEVGKVQFQAKVHRSHSPVTAIL